MNKLAEVGSIVQIIRDTLRMFCQGVKVAVEVAVVAADAGFVRTDEDILGIGRTGKGADAAFVTRQAISNKLLEVRVKKMLAKPI